jgi:hypothetical protein
MSSCGTHRRNRSGNPIGIARGTSNKQSSQAAHDGRGAANVAKLSELAAQERRGASDRSERGKIARAIESPSDVGSAMIQSIGIALACAIAVASSGRHSPTPRFTMPV